MRFRIGTFNAENLFARFKFRKNVNPATVSKEGWDTNQTRFDRISGTGRTITGAAIKALKADILGLQEIEALETLRRFVRLHLKGMKYPTPVLIDSHDPRYIDVALMTAPEFDITRVVTHQYEESSPGKFIFSRDCLECWVKVNGQELPVFVNHFKSMMEGRQETMKKREMQSEQVTKILKDRFGSNPGKEAWVVLGDLNDYPEADGRPSRGLAPLVGQPWIVNVIERLPAEERWTHYYKGGKAGERMKQLDYILLSRWLAERNPDAVPYIERRGLPLRAGLPEVKRFPGVGQNEPKASDHCPMVIELQM
jgi:endonuclease/exonuclease/phosphatase family metal-dependent hydrolase